MRYLIAILFAIAGAAAAMKFLSGPAADYIALHMKFDSSDDAENINQVAFMVVNLAGLVVGWLVGWAVGGPLRGSTRPQ